MSTITISLDQITTAVTTAFPDATIGQQHAAMGAIIRSLNTEAKLTTYGERKSSPKPAKGTPNVVKPRAAAANAGRVKAVKPVVKAEPKARKVATPKADPKVGTGAAMKANHAGIMMKSGRGTATPNQRKRLLAKGVKPNVVAIISMVAASDKYASLKG
jgi:hypothetical protein